MNIFCKLFGQLTSSLPSLILFVIVGMSHVKAQNIVLNEVVMGKAVVSSPTSVKMTPGFHSVHGSLFRAYIGSTQGSNPTHIISSQSSLAKPAPGTPASNFVKTIIYREKRTDVPSPNTPFKHNEVIAYYDGLGRPSQTISVGAAPSGEEDIIQPVLYDKYGRETYKTLPYTGAKSGNFRDGVTVATLDNYYNTSLTVPVGIEPSDRAYTQTGFDNSPLNRVVSQTGPGQAWASKAITMNYLVNVSNEVKGWIIGENDSPTPYTYTANTLYVTETIDEDNHVTREYKDKQGRVVQKSSLFGNTWLRTAYVYDDLDLLRCVVPPAATDPVAHTELCYYYKYDSRKRMIEKKIPGGGTISMVYDKRDRLRCTQNDEQKNAHEWSYIQYDELNRPVITGIIKNYDQLPTNVQAALDLVNDLNETYNQNTSYYGYNHLSFPGNNLTLEVLGATYYDDYDFVTRLSSDLSSDSIDYNKPAYNSGDYNFLSGKIDETPKGQVTGTMTKILSPADAFTVGDQFLFTANYYDKYGHVLRTISENHLKGKDVVSNVYENITYQLNKSLQQHFQGGQALKIEKTYQYDHTGRLLATTNQVNDQTAFTINAMEYNKVGQLITKYLHSNQTSGSWTFTQKVDYQYNLRGWLTRINDPSLTADNDLFGMQLSYNTPAGLGTLGSSGTACYNGNISGVKWGISNDNPQIRGYIFTYDELNRLRTTNYAEGSSLNTNTGYFTESVLNYNNNGNIRRLQRKYNNSLVDDLTYNYYGYSNKIYSIADVGTANSYVDDYPATSSTYTYDANGNMITDGSRGTTLSYHKTINVPKIVDFGNNNVIYYHYTSSGAKLIKHVKYNDNTMEYTHYIGNLVYEGGKLSYIITEEGRLIATQAGSDTKYVPEYSLKDHLGNNRVVFMGSYLGGGTVDVVQSTNYYPFGLIMTQTNSNNSELYSENKYLYNGKEIQDDRFGNKFFGMLDYGWRFYDPQIARFHSIDRLAAKYAYMTPYQYCSNRPIAMIEIDGLEGMWIHKSLFNSGWKQVQKVAFNTTSHRSFEKQVKGQTKYDVYYFKFGGEAAANGYEFSVKSYGEYKSLKYETDNGKQILNQSGTGFLLKGIDDKRIENLTKNGKGIIFIGINERQLNNADAKELSNSAATVLHEEGAHAENDLNGEQTTTAEDHTEYYNNEEGNWSPSDDAVRTDPNYDDSRAKKDITETDENAKKEYETQ